MAEGSSALTPLQIAATSLHEAFTELCKAGFTERQALIYLAEATRKPSVGQ